jgi:hypothetical protein
MQDPLVVVIVSLSRLVLLGCDPSQYCDLSVLLNNVAFVLTVWINLLDDMGQEEPPLRIIEQVLRNRLVHPPKKVSSWERETGRGLHHCFGEYRLQISATNKNGTEEVFIREHCSIPFPLECGIVRSSHPSGWSALSQKKEHNFQTW